VRMTAHDRYKNDPMFARIVDTLYHLLLSDDEHGKQYTATEIREAAMVATEKYEYLHLRPMFTVRSNEVRL
jgi:hypothetical protein